MKKLYYLLSMAFIWSFGNVQAQCTNNYYVVDSNPWGQTFNQTAMTNVFGAPNWTQANFSTSAATIFDPSVCFVMLEGGDANANALNTFLTNNLTLIESWVNNGGRLFINSAPNQGGNINLGFGGTLLNYPGFSTPAVAVNVNDPIFLGPYLPTATSYTGSSYSHASITGTGLGILLTGDNGTILANKYWGSGVVFFGGITSPNFHTPNTEAVNLWYNIFHYTANILLCTAPDIPTVSASTNNFCPGNNTPVTLTITAGNLNDATQWTWYSGSCGGTPVGTGTSINVTVNSTTTYYVRGEVGCIGVCAAITVGDTTVPTITAPANVSVSSDPGSCEATNVSLGTPVTADNCAVASVTNDAPTAFPAGTTTITWTVTDNSGNMATATQDVTVIDPIPPVITCPFVSISINALPGQCGAPFTYATPTATDNCSASGMPDLADVLANFDANSTDVLNTIPNSYVFAMDGPNGVNGNYISDGGSDMYDGGNYLNTNYQSNINYSDGVILSSSAFGTTGQYFTRYVAGGTTYSNNPAMFIMAADLDNVSTFFITGNNGADGSGSADGAVLSVTVGGVDYDVFIKRVYNAFDPSINHVMIIPTNASASHNFATNTDDDFHEVIGISTTTRIYYLLYAGNGGSYINNSQTEAIVLEFLSSIGGGSTNLAVVQTDATGLTSGDMFPVGITTLEYSATDASGNTSTCSFTIEVISEVSVTANITNVTTVNDGAINITVIGGAAPYSFAWTGPSGYTSSSEDISGLAPGTYEVTVTDGNGCDVTYTFVVNSVVGLTEHTVGGFELYPNPTNSIINIEVGSNGTLEIYNANGQLISSEKVVTSKVVKDVNHLATGVYTIRFVTEQGVAVKRLVVNK
jgi:hypothetical protein